MWFVPVLRLSQMFGSRHMQVAGGLLSLRVKPRACGGSTWPKTQEGRKEETPSKPQFIAIKHQSGTAGAPNPIYNYLVLCPKLP